VGLRRSGDSDGGSTLGRALAAAERGIAKDLLHLEKCGRVRPFRVGCGKKEAQNRVAGRSVGRWGVGGRWRDGRSAIAPQISQLGDSWSGPRSPSSGR
jgi:hypothetical protein